MQVNIYLVQFIHNWLHFFKSLSAAKLLLTWLIMKGVFLLLGFISICAIGTHFGLNGWNGFNHGDPKNIFTGIALIYVSVVLIFSLRSTDDWLLKFLNRNNQALTLAILFGVFGLISFAVGLLPAQ